MFVFDRTGKAFPIALNLNVQDDGGLTGIFTVTVPAGVEWGGPMDGDLSQSSYSPSGTFRIAQASDEGNATFIGKFEVPDPDHGIMWGTVEISKGGGQQSGTMALVYTTRSGTELPSTEPAEGVFADRIWDP